MEINSPNTGVVRPKLALGNALRLREQLKYNWGATGETFFSDGTYH
jgi:hypothetical protein